MIGLDTNVLVRYVTQDDPIQSPKANAPIESLSAFSPGFVSLVWVMELHRHLRPQRRQGSRHEANDLSRGVAATGRLW